MDKEWKDCLEFVLLILTVLFTIISIAYILIQAVSLYF